uniref:Programmed cell death protein 4 n=1 Tax=Panagrolaimus superbus TaxID=310955 RepID=A0A914YDG6_9BILA
MSNFNNATSKKSQKYEDPELEAEVRFAKDNGLEVPTKLAVDIAREQAEKDYKDAIAAFFEPSIKNGKNTKAERRARSRGVSGSSSRKDGNRFDYGLDCIDFAYEKNPVKDEGDMSSDEDEEYFEYDMVVTSNIPKIRSAIIDYLNNGNVKETVDAIDAYALTKDVVIKAMQDLITFTLDRGYNKVKAASFLFGGLMDAKRATVESIIDAFCAMLSDLENLLVDYPTARKTFEQLLARLFYDDIFTVEDIENIRWRVSANKSIKIDQICVIALSFVRNPIILRTMFNPPGGDEDSLDAIDNHFVNILREYFVNRDKNEASLRLKQLAVPHYHHSFVLQTLVFASDKLTEANMDLFIGLLKEMLNNGFITTTSIHAGFHLFFSSLMDLKFDLPPVYNLAKYLTETAHESKIIDAATKEYFPGSDALPPLIVEARKRVHTDDDDNDTGIGSLSSNASGDEEAIVKQGMNSPIYAKNDFKGNTNAVTNITGVY